MMKQDLSPLSKNQCYFVEDDFLDRANVDVLKGKIKMLDTTHKKLVLTGYRKPIEFDKILVAWGSQRKRMSKNYSNVHYIEDRHSHARLHNELLKAKSVTVVGNTINAFQIAESARNYLDEIGRFEIKVTLINDGESEVRRSMNKGMENFIKKEMKNNRINCIVGAKIKELKGDNSLESIIFNKEEQFKDGKIPEVDYMLKTDLVIAENGIDRPNQELLSMVGYQKNGDETAIAFDDMHIPNANVRFNLIHNDIHSSIYAVGNCAINQAFITRNPIRSENSAYNMEAAFFAAMSMMDKRVEFRYIPHRYMKINDIPIHYVGEEEPRITEVFVEGEVKSGKFIVWYFLGEEIVGFCTVGYQNLYIYLWEAMKHLIMPQAPMIRS